MTYETWRELLRNERLPAVLVDLEAFDRNSRAVLSAAQGKPVRLATKSIRVPALIRRALASSTLFQGLMCYSAEELEALAEMGFDDLMLAYPTIQRSDLAALRRTHDGSKQISVVVDSVEIVRALARVFEDVPVPLRVLIDIDVALRLPGVFIGVRRSPIRTDYDILALATEISKHSSLRLTGAMAYEAQVAGVGDRNPLKRTINPLLRTIRRLSAWLVARRRAAVRRLFEYHGLTIDCFNGGGTGSLNLAASEKDLTELAAGSALFSSHLFDHYTNIRFEPACFFATQVVRNAAPGIVTTLGGGYVASGEPGWDKVPLPYLPEGAKLLPMEAAGEVQTPLNVGAAPSLGDPVLFRHAKAGEVMERFNEVLLVSGGKIVTREKTYRGLGFSFL